MLFHNAIEFYLRCIRSAFLRIKQDWQQKYSSARQEGRFLQDCPSADAIHLAFLYQWGSSNFAPEIEFNNRMHMKSIFLLYTLPLNALGRKNPLPLVGSAIHSEDEHFTSADERQAGLYYGPAATTLSIKAISILQEQKHSDRRITQD